MAPARKRFCRNLPAAKAEQTAPPPTGSAPTARYRLSPGQQFRQDSSLRQDNNERTERSTPGKNGFKNTPQKRRQQGQNLPAGREKTVQRRQR